MQGAVDAHGTRAHATRALNGEQAVAGQRLVAAHEDLIALGAAACLHEALVGQVATRGDNDLRGRELLHAVGGANLHARNGAGGLIHHEVDELGAHEFLTAGRLKLAQHLVHEVGHALAAAGSSAHGKHVVGLHLGGVGEGAAMAHEPVIGSLGVGAHQLREAGVALALTLCVEGVDHLLDALIGILHREEELAAGDARVARRAHHVFLGDEQNVLHAVLKQTHARAQACQTRANNNGVVCGGSGGIGGSLLLAGLFCESRPHGQAGQRQPARCRCHKTPTRYLVCLALHGFLLDMNAWFRT